MIFVVFVCICRPINIWNGKLAGGNRLCPVYAYMWQISAALGTWRRPSDTTVICTSVQSLVHQWELYLAHGSALSTRLMKEGRGGFRMWPFAVTKNLDKNTWFPPDDSHRGSLHHVMHWLFKSPLFQGDPAIHLWPKGPDASWTAKNQEGYADELQHFITIWNEAVMEKCYFRMVGASANSKIGTAATDMLNRYLHHLKPMNFDGTKQANLDKIKPLNDKHQMTKGSWTDDDYLGEMGTYKWPGPSSGRSEATVMRNQKPGHTVASGMSYAPPESQAGGGLSAKQAKRYAKNMYGFVMYSLLQINSLQRIYPAALL